MTVLTRSAKLQAVAALTESAFAAVRVVKAAAIARTVVGPAAGGA